MKIFIKRPTNTSDRLSKINFNLTEVEFHHLVDELKHGREDLFEKIFLSHFSDCMSYLKSNYRIPHSEAYDLSMDTLIDFRAGLISNKYTYGNLRYLFTKMASQRLYKNKKKESRITITNECPEIEDIIEEPNDEDKYILKKAWMSLEPKSQSLLKKFYYDKMKLKEIGEAENISHSAIRKQKERSIIALRNKFIQLKKASL